MTRGQETATTSSSSQKPSAGPCPTTPGSPATAGIAAAIASAHHGYGKTPEDVLATVDAAIARGLAGIGVEDTTGDPANPIRDFDDAVRRIEAAAYAARGQILLTGRTDNLLWGWRFPTSMTPSAASPLTRRQELTSSTPSLLDMASISAVIRAVAPKPVNILVGPAQDTATGTPGDRCPPDQPRSRPLHAHPQSYTGGCCETCEGRSDGPRIESQLRPHHRPHQGLSGTARRGARGGCDAAPSAE
ncbi:isocitrate lyase/phosphoenolpyruvate mutase family protein [Streptomyces sp. NPDC055722]